MADQVLYSGVASITELMTKEGLINLDFADVRAVMSDMGKAMMGTGEASGDNRAEEAALAAISNPLLDIESMAGARGVLISIAGGPDLTLYEVDQAASRIREEVDPDANIIVGATIEEDLEGTMRVSVVATGLQEEGHTSSADATGMNATNATTAAPNTGMGGASPMTAPGIAPVGAPLYPQPDAVTGRNDTAQQSANVREHPPAAETMSAQEPAETRPQPAPELRPTQPMQQVDTTGFAEPAGEMEELPLSPTSQADESTPGIKGDASHAETAQASEKAAERTNGASSNMQRPQQVPPMQPERGGTPATPAKGGRGSAAHNIKVSDLPPNIQTIVEKKQEYLKQLGGKPQAGSRRRKFFGIMKGLLGAGQSDAEEPTREKEAPSRKAVPTSSPSPASGQARPVPPQGADMISPLEEDDELNIPAFLRRGGSAV